MPKLNNDGSPKTSPAGEIKYRAPALEKGLDILEVLAQSPSPLTLSQISTHLERSLSELFRMVQVLEMRGYLVASKSGEGYEVSNKLFSICMNTGATQNLLSAALPLMGALSEKTYQACHLVVASGDQMVVIARMEAPGSLSFSMRVGFRRDLVGSTSGTVLYAFQNPGVQQLWKEILCKAVPDKEWEAFEGRANQVFTQGYLLSESTYAQGVMDISCPVFNDAGVVAALAMPYIRTKLSASIEDSLAALRGAARRVSKALGA